jgi:hypothetical protein
MLNRLPSLKTLLVRGLLAACALAVQGAQARDLDPETRQFVIASCSMDAQRLCPQSLTSTQDAVSCMKSKRRELGHSCRSAYDKAVRILSQ